MKKINIWDGPLCPPTEDYLWSREIQSDGRIIKVISFFDDKRLSWEPLSVDPESVDAIESRVTAVENDSFELETNLKTLFSALNLPYADEYEYIAGLTIASGGVTPQAIYLQVDNDKSCYVALPNSTTLTSASGIINTAWGGVSGSITLIVPRHALNIYMDNSDYSGILNYNLTQDLRTSFCQSLTQIIAPNTEGLYSNDCDSLIGVSAYSSSTVEVYNCASISSVYAPNALYIDVQGGALTTNSIETLLAELKAAGNRDGYLDISSGTNADYATWSQQAKDDLAELVNITNNWMILYNSAE